MDIDFAFICDYAEVSTKINALGIGFDTVLAPTVPVTHPHLSIVIQLKMSVAEAGEKNLEAHLIDEDGKEVIPPVKGKFNVPKPSTGIESVGRIAMEFHHIQFPKYGSYAFHITIDGHEKCRIPLRVSRPPSTA